MPALVSIESAGILSKNARRVPGRSVIDVRPQIGDPVFTPPIELALKRMNNQMTLNEFVAEYLVFLNESVQSNPKVWVKTLRERAVVFAGGAFITEVVSLFMTKMGAQLLESKTPYLSSEQRVMILDFNITPLPKEPRGRMVVDPLAINAIQSSTCRTCRENRSAYAKEDNNTYVYTFVDKNEKDDTLATRNVSCCASNTFADGIVYQCPIFQHLIDGYKAGVTSQGTNLNPCKNCVTHIDNGGNCIGDRCPDGTFDIIPGSGLIRS
jgi:hypothetical protein